jgi:hypothetical protein
MPTTCRCRSTSLSAPPPEGGFPELNVLCWHRVSVPDQEGSLAGMLVRHWRAATERLRGSPIAASGSGPAGGCGSHSIVFLDKNVMCLIFYF